MDKVHRLYEQEREQRNINPHAEAVMAKTIWGYEYSRQKLGCMDWWDQLPEQRKRIVRTTLDRVASLPREHRPTPQSQAGG